MKEQPTLEQLKALAFDIQIQMEQLQAKYQQVLGMIKQSAQATEEPKEEVKEDKKK